MRISHDVPFFFLWFGAAVSLSEMLAGTLLAPLGFAEGMVAIVLGHVIGTTLLVLGGLIGTREGQTAMGTAGAAFGSAGRRLFAALNVLQLVGWTAIMLATGARQFAALAQHLGASGSSGLWVLLLAGMVAIWTAYARAGIGRLNTLAVGLLIVLLLAVFVRLFEGGGAAAPNAGAMRFGAALELVVVMPLSWLPLIADYNRHARSGGAAAIFSWLGYAVGSAWMYAIGLLMALRFGGLDFGALVHAFPVVIAVLLVIVLSTTTTTFLDAYSAAVSAGHVVASSSPRARALGVTVIGTVLALAVPIAAYRGFLYTLGALFSPLYAVVLARYYVLRARDDESGVLVWSAVVVWALGVASYYGFLALDTPLGATVPSFVFTAAAYVVGQRVRERVGVRQGRA